MFTYKPESTCELVIFDNTGQMKNHIKTMLRDYKLRWGESLASIIGVTDNLDELGFDTTVIVPEFIAYNINALRFKKMLTIDAIQNLDIYTLRRAVLDVSVTTFFNTSEFIAKVESTCSETIACDFEAASKYTSEEKEQFKLELGTADSTRSIWLKQQIGSSGLSHPSLVRITHLSIAISETLSYVLVIEKDMEQEVCDWLVSTDIHQVWHNISYDGKLIHHRTDRLPKSYDDSQLMWKTILNDADNQKSMTGLKLLAKPVYGSWGDGSKELFNLESRLDPDLIHYAGIDSQATYFVYNEANLHKDFIKLDTENYDIPLENLLPTHHPELVEHRYSRRYFYENVVKQLIGPTIRLMSQGIQIDRQAVENLTKTIDEVLLDVDKRLQSNKLIQDFKLTKFEILRKKKIAELQSKKRDIRQYLKDYKDTDLVMRSYVVNEYLKVFEDSGFEFDLSFWPAGVLPNGQTKWSVNDIKKMRDVNALPLLDQILDKSIDPLHDVVVRAMIELATYKTKTYNSSYDEKIDNIDISIVPDFNAGSSLQKSELFSSLGIECNSSSKATGADSWTRAEVERVNKETEDEDVKHFTQAFIDHSFSKIIRSNFLAAFDTYTVDGRLYGSYKLFGAKSFRYTSNSPNLLNAPSSGSIYAKPLKKCFVAQPGFIVAGSDYAQLEDRVIANLTNDEGKKAVFKLGIDSHCYNSLGYDKEEIESIIGTEGTHIEKTIRYKSMLKSHPQLDKIRSRSKGSTFKLAYLGYPDAEKGGTITQEIYDSYWQVLYKDIGTYKDKVIDECKTTGESYLGLGCYIRSSDIDKEFRTIFNANSQFWSVLTAISMALIMQRIDKAGMQDKVKITSTIYDSIYFEVLDDVATIQWLNDNLVDVMVKCYINGIEVQNEAALDVGKSWSKMEELPNNAPLNEIQGILDELD